MKNIAELIEGGDRIAQLFNGWPTFHDAEVVDLHLWRGKLDPERNQYDLAELTIGLRLWDIPVYFRFHDVYDLVIADFDPNNLLWKLSLRTFVVPTALDTDDDGIGFAVEFEPAVGFGASFKCLRVQSLSEVPDGFTRVA